MSKFEVGQTVSVIPEMQVHYGMHGEYEIISMTKDGEGCWLQTPDGRQALRKNWLVNPVRTMPKLRWEQLNDVEWQADLRLDGLVVVKRPLVCRHPHLDGWRGFFTHSRRTELFTGEGALAQAQVATEQLLHTVLLELAAELE